MTNKFNPMNASLAVE